jgi:hypothetical protein
VFLPLRRFIKIREDFYEAAQGRSKRLRVRSSGMLPQIAMEGNLRQVSD